MNQTDILVDYHVWDAMLELDNCANYLSCGWNTLRDMCQN